jgi:hypothetical protein
MTYERDDRCSMVMGKKGPKLCELYGLLFNTLISH